MRRKLWKICMWLSILMANISWASMLIFISYFWGYDQCAIDKKIAYFSAPAYLNLLNGLPWLLGTVVFGGLAFLLYCKTK